MLAAKAEAYSKAQSGRQRRKKHASGHALGPHRVVAGDHRGAVGGGKRRERRLHPCQRRIAMNMSEQRLDAGDQRPAVEQLADGDRRSSAAASPCAPGARAQIGVEIGGRRDAAGEIAPRPRSGRLRSRGTRRNPARSPRPSAHRPCRRRNPSSRRCAMGYARAAGGSAPRARAGRTSPGSDRDRSGSACPPSPVTRVSI